MRKSSIDQTFSFLFDLHGYSSCTGTQLGFPPLLMTCLILISFTRVLLTLHIKLISPPSSLFRILPDSLAVYPEPAGHIKDSVLTCFLDNTGLSKLSQSKTVFRCCIKTRSNVTDAHCTEMSHLLYACHSEYRALRPVDLSHLCQETLSPLSPAHVSANDSNPPPAGLRLCQRPRCEQNNIPLTVFFRRLIQEAH